MKPLFLCGSLLFILLGCCSTNSNQQLAGVVAAQSCGSPNATGSAYVAASGVIGSDSDLQGGSVSYSSDNNCQWTIRCPTAGSKVIYTFEGSTHSSSDVVYIRTDDNDSANKSFSGGSLSTTVLSNSQEIEVSFVSDGTGTSHGWSLSWSCSASAQRCFSPSSSNSSAGDGATYLNADSGTIMSDSDGVSSSESYALGQACNYSISCPTAGMKYIVIKASVAIDLRHSLKVVEAGGDDTEEGEDLDLTAGGSDESTYIISSNTANILFDSTYAASRFGGRGWSLKYSCSVSRCSATSPASGTFLALELDDLVEKTINTDEDGALASSEVVPGERCAWEVQCPVGTRFLSVRYDAKLEGGTEEERFTINIPSQNYMEVLALTGGADSPTSNKNGTILTQIGDGVFPFTAQVFFRTGDSSQSRSSGVSASFKCLSTPCSSPNQTATNFTGMEEGTLLSDIDGAGSDFRISGSEQCTWNIQCPSDLPHLAISQFNGLLPTANSLSIKPYNSTTNFTFYRHRETAQSDTYTSTELASAPFSAVFADSSQATVFFDAVNAVDTTEPWIRETFPAAHSFENNNYGFTLKWKCLPLPCLGNPSPAVVSSTERNTILFGPEGRAAPGSRCEYNITCSSSYGLTRSSEVSVGRWWSSSRIVVANNSVSSSSSSGGNKYVTPTSYSLSLSYRPSSLETFTERSERLFYFCRPSSSLYYTADGYGGEGVNCYSPNASSANTNPYSSSDSFNISTSFSKNSDGSGSGETVRIISDLDGVETSSVYYNNLCKWQLQCTDPSATVIFQWALGSRYTYWRTGGVREAIRILAEDGLTPKIPLDLAKPRPYYDGAPRTYDVVTPLAFPPEQQPVRFETYSRFGAEIQATCVVDTCYYANGTVFRPHLGQNRILSDRDGYNANFSYPAGQTCQYRITCPAGLHINLTIEGEFAGTFDFVSTVTGYKIGPDFYPGPFISSNILQFYGNFGRRRGFFETKNITLTENDVYVNWVSTQYDARNIRMEGWNITNIQCVSPVVALLQPPTKMADCRIDIDNDEMSLADINLRSVGTTIARKTYPGGDSSKCNVSFGCSSSLPDTHTMVVVYSDRGSNYHVRNGFTLLWETSPQSRVVRNVTNHYSDESSISMLNTSSDLNNKAVFQVDGTPSYFPQMAFYCLSAETERPIPQNDLRYQRITQYITAYSGSTTTVETDPRLFWSVREGAGYRRGLDVYQYVQCSQSSEDYRVAVVAVAGRVDSEMEGKDYVTIYNGETGARLYYSSAIERTTDEGEVITGMTARSLLIHHRTSPHGGDGEINHGYRIGVFCDRLALDESVDTKTANYQDVATVSPQTSCYQRYTSYSNRRRYCGSGVGASFSSRILWTFVALLCVIISAV